MKLIIVSGLSGSGKSVALHTLEDADYFCVDNLPVGLLPNFVDKMIHSEPVLYDLIAVAIDARSGVEDIDRFEQIIDQIKSRDIFVEVLFLTSDSKKLLSRFSETRRKHPLSKTGLPLVEVIELERNLLSNIYAGADLKIDTSNFNVHELRHNIITRLLQNNGKSLSILIQSFGFKHGIPADTDYIFDVRCLPNPYWEEALELLSGRDEPVIRYLESFAEVNSLSQSISEFLKTWIPYFEKENRSYMTISIGCTGGHHRSVYLVEKIAHELQEIQINASVHHRDLV